MKSQDHYFFNQFHLKFSLFLLIASIMLISVNKIGAQDDPFITTWKTDNIGITNESSIKIPTHPDYTYDYDVDWDNDGVYDEFGLTGTVVHDFGSPGTYTIRIKGEFPSMYFKDDGNGFTDDTDCEKLLSVDQWGDISWETFEWMFYDANNFELVATDTPDLNLVQNMERAFRGCQSFNSDIGFWDVSNVTNMLQIFRYCSFNKDISNWDVSNVTNMGSMFSSSPFNKDISSWDVSNVTNIGFMFSYCPFNQDIGDWDVSNATNMAGMFAASGFNQDIGGWDVSNVTNMYFLFASQSSFNQDISNWDVSSVTDMSYMFSFNDTFNQNINSWDVSSVTDMSWMFFDSDYNQPLGNWDVSNVTTMENMFYRANLFNQDISNWDVSNVTNMNRMFWDADAFNQDIGDWNVSNVTNMGAMFEYADAFNQDIGDWDVANVTDMFNMFSSSDAFNQDIGNWDVSSVTNMYRMFYYADAFNQDIGGWDVSNVTDMTSMFNSAYAFNQNIGDWDVSNVNRNDMPSLAFSGLSVENYDSTLIGWHAQGIMNKFLPANDLVYCQADSQRMELITNMDWLILGDSFDCSTPCLLSVIVTSSLDETCSGLCDGEATVTPSSGSGNYSYLWNDPAGQTTATAIDLCPGTYEVTVTDDDDGCTATASVTIDAGAIITASATVDQDESCEGACDGESTAIGGTIYEWSDGQTTATATNLCPGTYDVTVSDANGCYDIASITIQAGSTVTATVVVDQDESCDGDCDGEATASGGTSYEWSDGQMTATATDLCPGSYQVTVSDTNGCSDTTSVTIETGNTITASASVDQDESCENACDGEASSSGGINYEWSDGQTTATATDLCPGSYQVTVSDANGCSDTTSVTIEPGDTITASATVDQDETCSGLCNGEATASGGFSYEWSDGQTTETATGLCPGTYEVTVTGANGCTDVASVEIEEGISVAATAMVDQHETCLGDCDGQANASGGVNYTWSDGQSGATASNLCPGTYNVTVSDGNGCSNVASITIQAGTEITATATVNQDETCAGDCDGQATASGGISYEWSNGQTTPTITNLCPGSYDVTVTGANGCSDVTSITIQSGSTVTATAVVDQDESCAGECDGQATASGGTSYEWSDGQTTPTATNLCPGSYSVTVSDANGCSDIASVTIQSGSSVTATAVVDQDESCAGECDGKATASGGTNYEWSNGQSTATVTNLCSGSYDVTVSDANGCFDVTSVTIQAGATVTATATVDQDESCGGDCDGQATASGGTSFEWSDGQTSATATNLCSGSYDVTVSDANGCSDVTSVTIQAGSTVTATAVVDNDESCDGECDGQATASGGTSFTWSDGQTTPTATNLCSGSYSVTVSDANGCSDVTSVTIQSGQTPTDPTFSFTTTLCEEDDPISLPTTSDNGISGDWDGPGVSNNIFDPETAGVGNWNITFTPDAGQCANTATVTMIVEDCGCQNPASADAGPDQEECATSDVTIQLDGSITNVSTATWSTAGSGSFNDPDALDAVYTPSQADKDAGSVVLTLTTADPDGSGPCSAASDQITVTFNFQPEIESYDDIVVCDEYVLPAYQGDVSSNVGYFDGVGGTGISYNPGDVVSESTVMYVYDETSFGCSDETSFDITINEVAISVTVDNNASCAQSCDGQSTATGMGGAIPYSYEWSDGQTDATAENLCPATYTLTVTDDNGCTATESITIDEGPEETVPTFDVDTTACLTDSPIDLPLVSDNGIEGDWSGTGVSNNVFTPADAGVGSHVLTFSPDAGQCASTATVTMTVEDCGCQDPASANAGDDISICATADPVQLDGSIENVSEATWTSSGSGSFDDPEALDAVYTPSSADLDSGSVILTLTTADPDGSGPCSPASDQMVITFTFQPDLDPVDDLVGCDYVVLSAIEGETSSAVAYFTETGGAGEQYEPGDTLFASTTLFVYDATAEGCEDETSFEVEVFELDVDAGADQEIQFGNAAQLEGMASGGSGNYTYSWTPADQVLDPSSQQTETEDLTQTTDFVLFVTDTTTGCTDQDQVRITVVGGPLQVSVTPQNDTLCAGSSIELQALVSGGVAPYTYAWTSDPSGFDSDQETVMVIPGSSTTYTVEVTDDDGNTVTAQASIIVNALPMANAGDDQYICPDAEEDIIEVCADSVPAATYEWESSAGGTAFGRCVDLTAGEWVLNLTDPNGCSATDTIPIIESDLMVTLYPDSTWDVSGGLPPYTSRFTSRGDSLELVITDFAGCTVTDKLFLTSVLTPTRNDQVQVYPNPVRDRLQIETVSFDIERIELRDLHGRLHLEQEGAHTVLRVDAVPAGMYILALHASDGTLIQRRVVIQR